MTTGEAILALFVTDETVLRPSEILRRTGRKTEVVRTTIKRLVRRRQLFHICHSQYARSPNAKPLVLLRRGSVDALTQLIGALERRIDRLERLISDVVP